MSVALFPYEPAVDPALVNMDAKKLSHVVSRFKSQQASGLFPGGQLVVRRHGQVALNTAIGLAKGFRDSEGILPVNVTPETSFPAHSMGKPIAAIAIAMLEERGLLDVDTPIADIFPAFALHGKGRITILDVLTHQAGILVPSLSQEYKLADRETILEHLINAKPLYKRGTFAYLPTEYGIILCEVVQRLLGKTLSEFVTEEISIPLHLPALRFGLAGRPIHSLAYSYWLGKDKLMIAGSNLAENFEKINNATESFESLNPAFSLVTNAASLAAFYELLVNKGVTRGGTQLISEKTLHHYTSRAVSGWNKSLSAYMVMSRGFQLGARMPTSFGWWNTGQCFGHGGALSSVAFGDYQTGLSVAIVTNGNRSIFDSTRRIVPLTHQIRRACL